MTSIIQIERLFYRPKTNDPYQRDILIDINFSIEEGSFVAVVGKNGSGKTTLIKHICGLLLPTQGRVLVNGLDTQHTDTRMQLQTIVGMVFQNPADQIVSSTVEEDIAFGLENQNLSTEIIRYKVEEQLQATDLCEVAHRPPHLLSGGQIQKTALAGVLARQPKVILFDEPTSMLDPLARQSFFSQLKQLRQKSFTIVYVTHHMEEIINADLVIVLDDGRLIEKASPIEILNDNTKLHEIGLETPDVLKIIQGFNTLGLLNNIAHLPTDGLLHALPEYQGKNKENNYSKQNGTTLDDTAFIELDNVYFTYLLKTPFSHQALNGASLSVGKRSFTAIAGSNGSGKSTLLQHINGILRPDSGTVRVGHLLVNNPKTKLKEIIHKVGLVFQNPEDQFFEVFVGDEIAYGPKQFNFTSPREQVRHAMEQVGLDFETYKDRRLETLSGGEKRKVAIASTLALNQDTILFDEPTAGMDAPSRSDLLHLFAKLQNQGKTILIASHRISELIPYIEQLVLMKAGNVTNSLPRSLVMSNQKAIENAGLIPPLAMKIAQVLIEKGWPIKKESIFTPEQLLSEVKDVVR